MAAKKLEKFHLYREDFEKWGRNVTLFFVPLALLYVTQVLGVLNEPNHVVSVQDFAPSQVTVGGMFLYVFNGLYDLLRKYVA